MSILGAHQSIAGGYYKAVEIAHRLKCDCVQVFTQKYDYNPAKSYAIAQNQAQNLTNHSNFGNPTGARNSANFMKVITVDAPAPTPAVRELWLEIARRRLRWRGCTRRLLSATRALRGR